MLETAQASGVLDLVKRFVEAERKAFPVAEAYLFGSWAYGSPDSASDIDVGLVLEGEVSPLDESAIFSDAQDFNVRIETHVFSKAYFDGARKSIVYDIKEKGIKIA